MIIKSVNLYRCEHCRKRKALRPATIRQHEVHCFWNDRRTPYPGELTRSDDVMNEWPEHGQRAAMPPWWPGRAGLIFTGARWLDVPGYSRVETGNDPEDGPPFRDVWPAVPPALVAKMKSNQFDMTKPWYQRLSLVGLPQERFARHLIPRRWIDLDEGGRHYEIARVAAEDGMIVAWLKPDGFGPGKPHQFAPDAIVTVTDLDAMNEENADYGY